MILGLSARNSDDFENQLLDANFRPEAIVFFNYFEWNYVNFGDKVGFNTLVDFVNDRQIPLYIINGAFENSQLLHDVNDPRYSRVNVISYPFYCMVNWFNSYRPATIPPTGLNYHIGSLNNKPHRHRCHQMDLLAKYNLIDSNAISWNCYHYNEERRAPELLNDYNWTYWSPRLILFDEMVSEGNWGSLLPEQYHKSFIHLVTESSVDSLIISEKMVMAITCLKPFVVSSIKGYHAKLQDLGFELYDELFDYSFDLIEDEEQRFDALARILYHFSKTRVEDLDEIYQIIYPKVLRNRQNLTRILNDRNMIDPFILGLLENNQDIMQGTTIFQHYQRIGSYTDE